MKKDQIAKVSEVTFVKTNIVLKVKTSAGKTGWIKVPKKAKKPTDGVFAFEETWF